MDDINPPPNLMISRKPFFMLSANHLVQAKYASIDRGSEYPGYPSVKVTEKPYIHLLEDDQESINGMDGVFSESSCMPNIRHLRVSVTVWRPFLCPNLSCNADFYALQYATLDHLKIFITHY